MKRLFTTLLTLLVLSAILSPVFAGMNISVCRDTTVTWLRFRWSGVDTRMLGDWGYVAGGGGWQGDTFVTDASEDGTATFHWWDDAGTYHSITATADTPYCANGSNAWYPSAPAIIIPMTSDCAFVEIKNRDHLTGEWDGNWSQVTSGGELVLLHYGDTLIANPHGQSTDPGDYRAVETECY